MISKILPRILEALVNVEKRAIALLFSWEL